jgi:hypothetical protein
MFGPKQTGLAAVMTGVVALALLAACGGVAAPETRAPAPAPRPTASAATKPVAPAPAPCGVPAFDTEVVHAAVGATSFTADERGVFWSDGHDVWSAPQSGEPPRKILESLPQPVHKMRVVGERLFLLMKQDVGHRCFGQVAYIDRKGAKGPTTIGERACVRDFDVSGEWVVYTTDSEAPFDGRLQGSLWKAKIDGGPPSDLFNLFDGISNVVTDGKHAYAALAMDQLHRVALRTASAEVLNEGVVGHMRDSIWHSHLAVDDAHVFFAFGHINMLGAALYRMDKAPSGAEPVALGRMFAPIDGKRGWPAGDLLQTKTHLYWGATPEGRVLRVAKDGHCTVEEVAVGTRPGFVTPAGEWVYWLDLGMETRSVMRRRVEP